MDDNDTAVSGSSNMDDNDTATPGAVSLSSLDASRKPKKKKKKQTRFKDEDSETQGGVAARILAIPIAMIKFFERHPFTFVEIMIWFMYYVVGIVYYSNVEGWTTQTCIYFITVTFSTVGYGQYGPTTDDSRIFTSFYCIFGIVVVLTAINRAATKWLIKLQKPILDFLLGEKLHKPSTKISFSIVVVALVLFTGIFSFAYLESWDFATSFYWTVTTMTTVGYGDLMVTSEATRQFGVFFIYLCVFVYSLAIQNIYNSMQDIKKRSDRQFAVEDIRRSGIFTHSMLGDNLSQFLSEDDCAEFVLATLIRMSSVDIVEDCEPIIKFWMEQREHVLRTGSRYSLDDDSWDDRGSQRSSYGIRISDASAASGVSGVSAMSGMSRGTAYSAEVDTARQRGAQLERIDRVVNEFMAMKKQRELVERALEVDPRASAHDDL